MSVWDVSGRGNVCWGTTRTPIKSPGNDRLTKEFYETFWDELKDSFINSIKLAYQKKALSISQQQAVIKLIEKKLKK